MKRALLARRLKIRALLKCLFLVLGIYACFLSFGYFVEKLLKFRLDETRVFSFPIFVVVVTSASNLLMSSALLLAHHHKTLVLNKPKTVRKLRPRAKGDSSLKGSSKLTVRCSLFSVLERTHWVRLAISSFFCVIAQMTSTYALPRVGVPTQVIIKSSKMVPILIGGFLLFRKKYAWYDIFCVISVTFSLVLFNFGRLIDYKNNKSSVLGIFLCFCSLFCDGFVGPIQDNVLSKVDLHPHVLMFITNLVSLPVSLLVCFFSEGLVPFFVLCTNKLVLRLVLFLSVSGSFGQLFVFLCIKNYGSLYTGIITTLRKAFSTMLSVYIFKHRLTHVQWFALTLTFSTIFLQQFFKNKAKHPQHHHKVK